MKETNEFARKAQTIKPCLYSIYLTKLQKVATSKMLKELNDKF